MPACERACTCRACGAAARQRGGGLERASRRKRVRERHPRFAVAPDRTPDPTRARYPGQRGLPRDKSVRMSRSNHATCAVFAAALAFAAPALAASGSPRLVKGPYLTEL